jgi:phosphatidylglycerol:prolipoprotein diacylglycerol transferase
LQQQRILQGLDLFLLANNMKFKLNYKQQTREFMAINYPSIDPVLFNFGVLKISWYSLSYIVGIIFGYYYVLRINQTRPLVLDKKIFEDSLAYIIVGIILGGRLGYVFFYSPEYFISHPFDILKTWNGGMSFHGAVLGVVIAIYSFTKKRNIGFLYFIDYVAAAAPIGFFFGRLANFVNDELWGKVSSVPWAVLFPRGGYLPRHPSQIYEAIMEGVLLFIILNLVFKSKNRDFAGRVAAVFLIIYATFRIVAETFRQPDEQLGYLMTHLTMGQILSLPMIVVGIITFFYAKEVKVKK